MGQALDCACCIRAVPTFGKAIPSAFCAFSFSLGRQSHFFINLGLAAEFDQSFHDEFIEKV